VFNVLSSATEARPAGDTRVLGVSRGERKNGIYYCWVLAAWSISMSSRPVSMANLIVARTASIFGVHVSRSDGAFPPR
jgi:hypothetical protein